MQQKGFQRLIRRDVLPMKGQPNYQRKKNMHMQPDNPQFINKLNRAGSVPSNLFNIQELKIQVMQIGRGRDDRLTRNISVPNERCLPLFQDKKNLIPGVSRFMSAHAYRFYSQHKAEYKHKWETRKANANNRGNYEDGVFFSQKPTITACCVCQNVKLHAKNYYSHIRSDEHMINLQSPLIQISFYNLNTFCSSAFRKRFKDYAALLESFGSFFPLEKRNYFLSYSENINDLPMLDYNPKQGKLKSKAIVNYQRKMKQFEELATNNQLRGKSLSYLKTHQSSTTNDKSEGMGRIPICSETNRYFDEPEQQSDLRYYREYGFNRKDIKRIGEVEINRTKQFMCGGNTKKDFAWDLMYHLARQKKSINEEVLNQMPEEQGNSDEFIVQIDNDDELLPSMTSQGKSQVLQKIDANISPARMNGINKRLTAPKQSQSIASLLEKVQKIEDQQRRTELSFNKKRKVEVSSNGNQFYSQWNSQLREILSSGYKCGDQNMFTQRSSEEKKILKRDEKRNNKAKKKIK